MRNIPGGKTYHCQKYEHRACDGKYCRCFCHLFDDGPYGFFEAVARMAATLWSGALDVLTPRRRYKAELDKLSKEQSDYVAALNKDHRRQLETQGAQVQEALRAIGAMKVAGQYESARPPNYTGRYAITTYMSDDLVYSFMRTNMPREEIMEMIAHQMTHEFRRQFAALDFGRVRAMSTYEDYGRRMNFGPGFAQPEGEDFKGGSPR